MEKTLNERLFEQLMRTPHVIRRALMEATFGEGPFGCGPMERPGHGFPNGPERRFEDGPGFCGRGKGPMPMHGPEHGPEHCRKHNPVFGRDRVLEVIGRYENGVRQKTLTGELRINPSSVSEMISKLENDGYVKRTIDPEDKRATLITLTELGSARAAELSDERNGKLDHAFRALSDEEKEQLILLLRKLTEAE